MSWQRDERLEAVIRSSRADDTPWLVYGDWLAEHGDDDRAAIFHALGGRLDATSSLTRRALAMAVASSMWSLSRSWDEESTPRIGLAEALPFFAKTGRADWPKLEGFPPLEPLIPTVSALKNGDLVAAARALPAPEPWFTHFISLLETDDAFTPSLELADALDTLSSAIEPAKGTAQRFSFAELMINNSTRGVEGAVSWTTEATAPTFITLAQRISGEGDDFSLDEIIDDASGWTDISPFACVDELFLMLEQNEGHQVAVDGGDERGLVELLAELGPCLGGARSDSDFTYSFMRFVKGSLAFHFSY